MSKITIIGTGSVGSTIAYTMAVMDIASEILVIDINNEKALGEATDIRQGTPFCSPCSIHAGDYSDAANSDIVIITSGIARKVGQTRLELAKTNVDIIKSIIPQITRYAPEAKYIIVSNPVDVLTYTFCKYSGLPEKQIVGSGTILDTSRLRSCMSDYYAISQNNVHAYVFGEHGDSSFIPWSLANISNVHVDEYPSSLSGRESGEIKPPLNHQDVEEYVRKSGARVIERKGATFYAVSAAVSYICKALLNSTDTTMTLSTMMHGEYGIEDVCISVLCAVNQSGLHGKVLTPLTDDEILLLRKSADTIKGVIKGLNI